MKYILSLILSILLALVLLPIGFFVGIWRGGSEYLYKIALSIDQMGNVVCATLFNLTLIKTSGYKFGFEDEVISSVIGKNCESDTLTSTGKLLNRFLNMIDKEHCIKSIENYCS